MTPFNPLNRPMLMKYGILASSLYSKFQAHVSNYDTESAYLSCLQPDRSHWHRRPALLL
jgi:hypothetical protein